MNNHRMQEKQIKTFFENGVEKEFLFANHAIFATEVSRQFHPPKHFKPKVFEKFAKCFSRLEVSLARES